MLNCFLFAFSAFIGFYRLLSAVQIIFASALISAISF